MNSLLPIALNIPFLLFLIGTPLLLAVQYFDGN